MLGEKFYKSLDSLDRIELNNFIRFSKSEFLNKKTEIVLLAEFFKNNKTHFLNLLKNETLLFKKVYPQIKAFDRVLIKNLFHYAIILFEKFIIYNEPLLNKELKYEILSEFYKKKNLQKEALQANKKLFAIVDKSKINYKNYNKLFKLNLSKFEILINDFDYNTFQYAEKSLDYLEKYYYLEKINLTHELQSDSLMSNRKYQFTLLEEIKNKIKNNKDLSKILIFEIFALTIDLYERKVDKKTYLKLKSLVYDNIDKFDFRTKRMFLSDVGNYQNILYSKTSDNNLIREVFDHYKMQVKHGTMIRHHEIPDANFSQVIRICLYLKEYTWAKSFIKESEKYLKNKDLVLMSEAEIAYSMKEYNFALDILNKIDSKKTKLLSDLKSLFAKIFYDTNEISVLEYHLTAFETYLRRDKTLNKRINDNNIRFVLYLKRIIHNKVNDTNLKKLIIDLEKDKSVFNRNWLISKINNLLKK